LLSNLSEDEIAALNYSKRRFTKVFEDKLGSPESKTVEPSLASSSTESEVDVFKLSTIAEQGNVMLRGYEGVNCAKCMHSLKPKLLPCLHVCCLRCLEGTARMTIENPVDMIPTEGFDSLDNFEDVEEKTEPAQSLNIFSTLVPDNICDVCFEATDLDDVVAVPQGISYCFDCDKKLCASCLRTKGGGDRRCPG